MFTGTGDSYLRRRELALLGPSGPQIKVEPESPFIQAAWEGNVSLVRAMLKGFPGVIDVNHTASVTPLHNPVTSDTVPRYPCPCHHTTALRAAVCNGHLEIAQVLINSEASVNRIANCKNSTPLHEAASQKDTKMVEVLHKHGTHIDAFNADGLSPLCVALTYNRVDTIRYLLKAGTSALPPNPASLSAMHVAAAGGELKSVELLLAHGVSPMFSEPSLSSEGYIPCPLYIAAVYGHSDVVATLMSHPECSPACRADALLLLGSQKITYALKGEQDPEEAKELWRQALKIREEHRLVPKFLPPIPAYGNAVEIQNVNDLEQLFDSESSEAIISMQSLIILERCMGFLYIPESIGKQVRKSFFHELLSACCNLHDKLTEQQGQFEELVLKLYESLKRIITHSSNSSVCDSFDDQLFNFSISLRILSHLSTQQMLKSGMSPQFQKLICLALEIIEDLQAMCATETPCGATTNVRKVIRSFVNETYPSVLFYFLCWLQHSSHSILEGDEEEMVGSDECESAGREFVRKHLRLSSTEKHTLLNYSLCHSSHILSKKLFSDLPVVIVALLRWVADAVINLPYSEGQRPLHLAVKMHTSSKTTIVSHLLDCGAHYDAVNAEGKAFYELSEAYPTDIPLPLVCQASRKIVAEAIPYLKLDIPKHVKEFVCLHDPKPLYKHGLKLESSYAIVIYLK